MIIDKKGKLFGKISIVDILILLVILVGFVGTYFTLSTVDSEKFKDRSKLALNSNSPLKTATVTFEVKGVRQVTKDGLKVGDVIYESMVGNEPLGVIKEVSSETTTRYLITDDGTVCEVEDPGYFDVKIVMDITGKDTKTGFYTESGIQMLYGKGVEIRNSAVKTYFTIVGIEY